MDPVEFEVSRFPMVLEWVEAGCPREEPPPCPYCDPEIPNQWRACPVHRDGNG